MIPRKFKIEWDASVLKIPIFPNENKILRCNRCRA